MEGKDYVDILRSTDCVDTIEKVLAVNKNLINQFFTGRVDGWGRGTLLHFACRWGRLKTVTLLLSQGANPGLPFDGGHSYAMGVLSYSGYTAEQIVKKKLGFTRHGNYRSILELFVERRKNFAFFKSIGEHHGYPVLGCNRGGSGALGPPNTMYTFLKCRDFHCSAFKLDLQVTKDDHLVIIDNLEQSTDGVGTVGELSLIDIKHLNAAKLYPLLTNVFIPTLGEFMEEFGSDDHLLLYLDCKNLATAKKVIEVIEQMQLESKVILTSSDDETQLYFLTHKPPQTPLASNITTSAKILYKLEDPLHEIVGVSMEGWLGMLVSFPLTKEWVNWIHEEGRKVAVFGAPDEQTQQLCVDVGVDFIFSDSPDLLFANFGKNK